MGVEHFKSRIRQSVSSSGLGTATGIFFVVGIIIGSQIIERLNSTKNSNPSGFPNPEYSIFRDDLDIYKFPNDLTIHVRDTNGFSVTEPRIQRLIDDLMKHCQTDASDWNLYSADLKLNGLSIEAVDPNCIHKLEKARPIRGLQSI